MTTQPTVYVVDDDPSIRDAIRCVVESISLPVETFASCEEFLDVYAPGAPGCLVLDVRLPGMGGFELQDKLAAESIGIPIILITGYGEVSMAVRAIKNGAMDFLTKPFGDQDLLDAVRQALDSDAVARDRQARALAIEQRYDRLTSREREVMALVIAGKANKVIAAELGVSCKTVEGHRSRVMEKMEADSLPALVRMGMAMELPGTTPQVCMGKRQCTALLV